MNFKEVETREHTKAFTLPDAPEKKKNFVRRVVSPYRFCLFMGLSCTGKTGFINVYGDKPNWTLTKWNRDAIWDMIFQDGTRVDKYHNYIQGLEGDLFPQLFERECHQVIVEGWNRVPSGRRRYLNYIPEGIGPTACFVFDGPIEKIIDRNKKEQKLNLSEAELPVFLKEKHEGIVWPEFNEGWDDIYYINTFGPRGEEYLQQRLV